MDDNPIVKAIVVCGKIPRMPDNSCDLMGVGYVVPYPQYPVKITLLGVFVAITNVCKRGVISTELASDKGSELIPLGEGVPREISGTDPTIVHTKTFDLADVTVQEAGEHRVTVFFERGPNRLEIGFCPVEFVLPNI